MSGINASDGRQLDELAHLQQSVRRILTTPIGSRVMRRDFGSQLPELIDAPLNGATALRVLAATAMALTRWEPRLRLTQVQLQVGEAGALAVELRADRIDGPRGLHLSASLRNPDA
ncbi:GPW/gp25 family protein [Chitiniphilus purpureus]|uniref:GPW/gp25 family protein n=1 Tax=Chitiniphilus purpureus TaxID=2981137 RepID=A0ABY6DRS1_9NEIS|nr:GPW/gp25 family protein [Chitiniphilus sp. CD1]UXY16727.1 GPW/gp25 family protein [Chitiniphilus sp. CD1]